MPIASDPKLRHYFLALLLALVFLPHTAQAAQDLTMPTLQLTL